MREKPARGVFTGGYSYIEGSTIDNLIEEGYKKCAPVDIKFDKAIEFSPKHMWSAKALVALDTLNVIPFLIACCLVLCLLFFGENTQIKTSMSDQVVALAFGGAALFLLWTFLKGILFFPRMIEVDVLSLFTDKEPGSGQRKTIYCATVVSHKYKQIFDLEITKRSFDKVMEGSSVIAAKSFNTSVLVNK